MPVKIQTYSGSEMVEALHEEGGLAVTAALGFKRGVKRYCITHAQSGYVVGEEVLGASRIARTFTSQGAARKGLEAILPLTDWTRPGDEVAKHSLQATRVLAELLGDEHTLKAMPRPTDTSRVGP